ncbi:MAG TPA: MarC family protein [Bacteroidales bacterium]|nr:MarC family protein [Bacteroidales bacterium]HPS51295.1 MarC family protein [Bacteroidales bacterium]
MDSVRQLLHDYLLLFAMVNAIGNLPLFADLTSAMNKKEQSGTYKIAVLTGGSIVLGFALFGDVMLRNVFNVSMPAFKIAGGILVFIVAARGVILGSQSSFSPVQNSQSVAVFPMGFPFLAGPGTILTTILLLQSDGHVITVITVFLVYITIFPILKLAPFVERIVGKIGVLVISRILYIFICAKAASFIFDGFHIKL